MTEHAINKMEPVHVPALEPAGKDDAIKALAADRWSQPGHSGSPVPLKTERDSANSKSDISTLGFPNTQVSETPFDPMNPSPETWKYDSKGHLLSAGDRVSAEYDAQGNLKKATFDGKTFERKGNDVYETGIGGDGESYTFKIEGISKFDLKTEDRNSDGKFKTVDLEALTENGSGELMGGAVWESAENRMNYAKALQRFNAANAAKTLDRWPTNF